MLRDPTSETFSPIHPDLHSPQFRLNRRPSEGATALVPLEDPGIEYSLITSTVTVSLNSQEPRGQGDVSGDTSP